MWITSDRVCMQTVRTQFWILNHFYSLSLDWEHRLPIRKIKVIRIIGPQQQPAAHVRVIVNCASE